MNFWYTKHSFHRHTPAQTIASYVFEHQIPIQYPSLDKSQTTYLNLCEIFPNVLFLPIFLLTMNNPNPINLPLPHNNLPTIHPLPHRSILFTLNRHKNP